MTISRNKMAGLCLSLGILSISSAEAVTYYSRGSGNWNDNNSWSTVGYGNATNTGTYPKSTDVANIGDGYTLTVNATLTVGTINIGQGTSGIVEFGTAASYTLTIVNSLAISAGAKVWYNGNASRAHNLQIGTHLTNAGSVDLYQDADDYVNLSFYRSANSVVSGNGTWDLNAVSLAKSTSSTYYLDVQSSGFEAAIRDFTLTYGTYNHNNSGSWDVNTGSGSSFSIPADGVFKVTQGTVTLSPSQDTLILSGSLVLTGGTLYIGASTGLAGIRYDKTTTVIPKLEVQNGNLIIYGGICARPGASSDPFQVILSGGTTQLNTGSSGTPESPFSINDVASSSFTMTDGSLIFKKPNSTGSSVSDCMLCSGSGVINIGGGLFQFGDSNTSTATQFTYSPSGNTTFPNIKVTSNGTASVQLCPSVSNTEHAKMISLYVDYNCSFDVRSISGTTGDSRDLILTGNMDGLNSLYLDGTLNTRSCRLLLQGGEGQQLAGSASLSVLNLELNNASGSVLNIPVTVNGSLTLTDGILYSSSSALLTLSSSASNDAGSAASYIDGPMAKQVAASGSINIDLPLGKNGAYRPVNLAVNHSTAATVTYTAEIMSASARDFNYTMPGGIEKVSAQRYLQLTRTGAANLTNAQVILTYDTDDGVSDYAQLSVVCDNGSGTWLDLGGTATGNSSGSITSDAFVTMGSLFTLANRIGGGNPLPVKMLAFHAKRTASKQVQVEWSTASERNADYFEVQGAVGSGAFAVIGYVKATGTSSRIQNYQFTDDQEAQTTAYYRLRIVDKDGYDEYSAIASVESLAREISRIYPNPGKASGMQVDLASAEPREALHWSITDRGGRVIATGIFDDEDQAMRKFPMPQLPAGVWLFTISDQHGASLGASLLQTE